MGERLRRVLSQYLYKQAATQEEAVEEETLAVQQAEVGVAEVEEAQPTKLLFKLQSLLLQILLFKLLFRNKIKQM
jgi:hypothetical protein